VPKRTLFHILLEQPWWVSLLAAAGMFGIFGLFSAVIGVAAATPFLGIAGYLGVRRVRLGPQAEPVALMYALRSASPEELRDMLRTVYEKDGHSVTEVEGGDLLLDRQGYRTLVRYRRWRAQSTGPATIHELAQAMRRHNADRGMHLTAGSFTDAAKPAADAANVTPVDGAALAQLLRRLPGAMQLVRRADEARAQKT